jgi:hypothetical protein
MVRVISKKLAHGKYFNRKALVDKVHDKYTAKAKVVESSANARDGGNILPLDQDDLATAIPKETGKKVQILTFPKKLAKRFKY